MGSRDGGERASSPWLRARPYFGVHSLAKRSASAIRAGVILGGQVIALLRSSPDGWSTALDAALSLLNDENGSTIVVTLNAK